jgi:hypothetical protein
VGFDRGRGQRRIEKRTGRRTGAGAGGEGPGRGEVVLTVRRGRRMMTDSVERRIVKDDSDG